MMLARHGRYLIVLLGIACASCASDQPPILPGAEAAVQVDFESVGEPPPDFEWPPLFAAASLAVRKMKGAGRTRFDEFGAPTIVTTIEATAFDAAFCSEVASPSSPFVLVDAATAVKTERRRTVFSGEASPISRSGGASDFAVILKLHLLERNSAEREHSLVGRAVAEFSGESRNPTLRRSVETEACSTRPASPTEADRIAFARRLGTVLGRKLLRDLRRLATGRDSETELTVTFGGWSPDEHENLEDCVASIAGTRVTKTVRLPDSDRLVISVRSPLRVEDFRARLVEHIAKYAGALPDASFEGAQILLRRNR